MKKTTLALLLVAVLAITGCTQAEKEEVTEILTEEEPTIEQSDQTVEALSEADSDEEQDQEEVITEEETATAEEESTEVEYAAAVYTKDRSALDSAGPKVVYFHATWCPTCRALEERVQNTLSEFPDGTKIVQVDFDTEKELKKQYGIKVQTSLVVLDASGNQVGDILINPSNSQLIEAINQTL